MASIYNDLLDNVEALTTSFNQILDIIDKNNLDLDNFIVDDYPFELSFDEQCLKVIEWRNTMRNKLN
ncbi:MAG: hypothetical protein IJZ79_03370 [Bacilli bacterium]|nr:hypothetical protein [Bacilli bacterium]MBQ8218768.1 hypothetical protein [Bacilli bacterium]